MRDEGVISGETIEGGIIEREIEEGVMIEINRTLTTYFYPSPLHLPTPSVCFVHSLMSTEVGRSANKFHLSLIR